MNDTIKGALIGAIIPTVGSFTIFFLGNFHTEEQIEKQNVAILSEAFDYVDKDMSFQQSIESLKEHIKVLEEENHTLNISSDEKNQPASNKKDKRISLFHLKDLYSENVGL